MTRAEFLFRARLPALLKRTWHEILMEAVREGEEQVAYNASRGLEPSTHPYVYYDPGRRYRRWYWKERKGPDRGGQRYFQTVWQGPHRLTEAQAIEDQKVGRDTQHQPVWGTDERKALRMMYEELWQPDPLHNIGAHLLKEYEPNISTRWRRLFPLWVLADCIRQCPQGRTQHRLIKEARRVLRDVLQSIRYDRPTKEEEEDLT